MGSAIVYCARCSLMLRDTDFGKGGAVRVDGRPYCTACACELFPSERLEFGLPVKLEILPSDPKPPPSFDDPRRATRPIRTVEPLPKSGSGLWIVFAGGGAVLVVVLLAVALGGRPAPPPKAPPPPDPVAVVPVEPTRPPPATPPRVEPPKAPEDPLAPELARLEGELRGALGKEEFGRAIDLLDTAKTRRPEPAWSSAIAKRLDEARQEPARLYPALEKSAVEAKRRGAQPELRAVIERVAKWGIESHRTELDRALAAASPPPPPPPPAAPPPPKPWAAALSKAAARDYAGAIADLERAQLDADVQLLRPVAALHVETARLLSQWPRDQKISLDVLDADGAPRTVEGTLLRADGFRAEIGTPGGAALVVYGEILPASLADLFRNRRTRKPGDARTAALLCLLERDVPSARKILGEPATQVPEKYWEHAATLPATDPREGEARKLFLEAEGEVDGFSSAAAAAAKFAALLKGFPDCAVVRRNAAYITARSHAGREYFFVAENLAGTGVFRWSRTAKREAFWTAGADIEAARRKESYVELEFSAVPDLEYEVWIFVGGCCVETTACHAQAGEQLGTDASTPVKHGLSATRHRAHAGRREPTLWGWAKLPHVKSAAGGPQKVRLAGEQAGFSVAYAWVTALDRPPPREPEIKELERARASTPGDRTFRRDGRAEPGLIGWWKFDDGAGAAASDASKALNPGAIAGPAWAGGVAGGALSFDGVDDLVTLARSPAAVDSFTMAFWANPSAERKSTPQETEGVPGIADQRYAIFPSIHPAAGAGVSVGTNGVSVFEHSGNYLPSLLVHDAAITGWTHVAVVYRDRQPRLYLNGVFVREGLKSSRAVVPGWHFGGDGGNYGPYKGLLDEVRIYDRALAEGEITALAARPRTIPRSP